MSANGETRFQRALLVEDESNLAVALEIALRKIGIECDHASTLKEAEERLAAAAPDLIVLDRQLPDGDGISLCQKLRSQGFGGAILMLTARGETEQRIEGLNSGADDYLPKPFSWLELEARIRAISRRGAEARPLAPSRETAPSHELWSCDETKLRVLGPGGWVELTPLEFKLASHLIQSEESILTRDELLKKVWGFTLLPKTRTVDHFLGRLRKHFEENPEEPRHFVTVRGAGYQFRK